MNYSKLQSKGKRAKRRLLAGKRQKKSLFTGFEKLAKILSRGKGFR